LATPCPKAKRWPGLNDMNVEGWTVRNLEEVDSTNLFAASLGAWDAVRAARQTRGRGRFQRSWISDEGGLWLSAVLPVTSPSAEERALPLVVGLSVADTLRELGVAQLRLRWPNDILVGDRKLAGLLIEQFAPGLAVAGIGVNVRNQPEARDSTLKNQTIRLTDVLSRPPSLDQLTALILQGLTRAVGELKNGRLPLLLTRVNELWAGPRRVELDLDGDLRRGTFMGIENDGRLILLDDSGHRASFQPHQVRHLQETPNLL